MGLKNLFLDRLSFLGKTVGVEDLNLDDIEWALGGDIGGARLADRDEVKKRDAKEKAKRPDPNRLTLSIDDRQGIVRLTLPRLELSGFNRSFTNTSLRTGRISLEGVDITASFSDRGYERPAGAIVDATKTDVRDAVLTGPGLPGSLIALTRLLLGKFHFVSGRTGEENLTEPTKDGWIAIPIIDPFLRLLSHIVSFTGTVPGLSSALSRPVRTPGRGRAVGREAVQLHRDGGGAESDRDGPDRSRHRRHLPPAAHRRRASHRRRLDDAGVLGLHRRHRHRRPLVRRRRAGGDHQDPGAARRRGTVEAERAARQVELDGAPEGPARCPARRT